MAKVILSLGFPLPLITYKGRGKDHLCERYSNEELLEVLKKELDRINSTNVSEYLKYKSIDMPSREYLLIYI